MRKRIPILIGFILLSLALWLQMTSNPVAEHMISRLEQLAYDIQIRTTFLMPFTSSKLNRTSLIAIVDINDATLKKEGRWPWPRHKIGKLIQQLTQSGAVIIALDMLFPEPEPNSAEDVLQELSKQKLTTLPITTTIKKIAPLLDYDTLFATDLRRSETILGVSISSYEQILGTLSAPLFVLKTPEEKSLDIIQGAGFIGNIALLSQAAKGSGFINFYSDPDGIIRRVPLLMRYQDNIYPSLALEAVRAYLLTNVSLITAPYHGKLRLEGVQIGNQLIPTDSKAQVLIPFHDNLSIPFYSAVDVLENKIPTEAFAGKIIFIGSSATGLGDLRPTPVLSTFPGVAIQAAIANNILLHHFFPHHPDWVFALEFTATLLLGVLAAIAFAYCGPKLLVALVIITATTIFIINTFVWQQTGLIISFLMPMALLIAIALINLLYGYFFENRRREHLRMMFGQYVPEKHIDEMLIDQDSFAMAGEDRNMTVLFADIRNFTSISENLSASQLKILLNDFFTPMTEVIFKHRGTIDKYIGDLIMAFWGAPMHDKKHAQHALLAALEMQTVVKKLNPAFKAQNRPELTMGIGLNTGVMSIGDMGSKFRRNYTVLGDAVNLASRLENLTKYYDAKIIVSKTTYHEQPLFLFRHLDRVRVKGKTQGIDIYELICHYPLASRTLIDEIALSNEAMQYYFNREWKMARSLFQQLAVAQPDVRFYALYLSRIDALLRDPPDSNWDGVFVYTEK